MANQHTMKKRKNQGVIDDEAGDPKRSRTSTKDGKLPPEHVPVAGKIKKIVLRNFLCHDHLVMDFNQNVNFIVGRNGSGKSAILSAITVGLGGRASTTQRGESYQSFIKHGKNSCSIEITLTNDGAKAYEPDIYGNVIKIIRSISHSSSTLTLKNQRDQIIGKKRSDLDKVTSALNIQVDNPISILNQKCSKTFLVDPKPESLYKFFMKGTQLETIGNNYKEAMEVSKATHKKMEETKEQLDADKQAIDEIEASIRAIEELEIVRLEYDTLQCELRWSRVIHQEKVLNAVEKTFEKHEKIVENVLNSGQSHNTRCTEIEAEIEGFAGRIKELEDEASDANKARDQIRTQLEGKRDELNRKAREYKSNRKTIKGLEEMISTLTNELKRLDEANAKGDQDKQELKERLAKLEEHRLEIEAMISSTMIDQTHVDSDKIRLENEERECNGEVNRKEIKLTKLKGQLNNLAQQGDNSLTVFGRNMPRLMKRIEEEYKRGRFREKPRGPIGSAIKMKDSTWTTTVETFFGSTLSAFCVDNNRDASLLGMIIKEVYQGDRAPDIYCSKFIETVHDVRRNSSRTERYPNILDVMEISDAVIANCVIDQRAPESILLIPTSDEAIALLQNIENVPQNCRRALTRTGDTFYPEPNYRTYGGSVHSTARYLQVSTTELMQSLKQEIMNLESELRDSRQQLAAARDKVQASAKNSHSLMTKMKSLRTMQTKAKNSIDEIKDKLNEDVPDDDLRRNFNDRRAETVQKLEEAKALEQQLSDDIIQLQQEVKDIEVEFNRCRQLSNSVDEKINPIKIRIRKLEEEKNQCQIQIKQAERKVQEARHEMQKMTAQVETEKRVLMTLLGEAEEHSERIESQRSPDQIKKLAAEKKHKIQMVERQYGSKEDLQQQLEDKTKKYKDVQKILQVLMETNYEHLLRVDNRRKEYRDMREEMGEKVQIEFETILNVREYRGSLNIDYSKKTLTLDVVPQNTVQRETNQTSTLSGGERSYATVAFILALWECTTFPFYFLDEFDVFMDKVNRRVIMEILLDHTRAHPECQYGFLTPLDASIVKSDYWLTIHQLEAPERGEASQV